MINTPNVEKMKQLLKNESSPKIVVAQDDAFNRKAMEYGKFDVLVGIENPGRKLNLRNIDSGLNPFLALLMAKNNIALGMDLEAIRKEENYKKKAILIAQISQNIRLCRKKGVKLAITGLKDSKDANALLQTLGASSGQIKKALAF